MLSGIASCCGSLANAPVIRARAAVRRPLPQQRPATPQAERLGRSGGSGRRGHALEVKADFGRVRLRGDEVRAAER